jgi:hypothetical protein
MGSVRVRKLVLMKRRSLFDRRKKRLFARTLMVIALLLVIAGCGFTTGGTNANQTPTPGIPKPVSQDFKDCPPSGDGGDPVLNTLKNRIDEAQWLSSSVTEVLSYTWPRGIEGRPRFRWSKVDAAVIAKHEGLPVQLEGYFAQVKRQGPESCNCHSVEDRDYHIWLMDSPNAGRAQSVVIETTPRVSAYHPAWTTSNLTKLSKTREKVRVSGWLMMDPEHPDQIGKTRGTIWEVHPVMQIEVWTGGRWQPLDNGSTGVTSASVAVSAPATASVTDNTFDSLLQVTPESTASPPLLGSANQQRNQDVQITNIFYDGQQGSSEPDEYVVVTNKGQQPVDVTDWELQDPTGNHEYKWESYVIQPGQSIRVYTNEVQADTGGFSFGSNNAIWNNSGDVAELYDADKQLVSRYAYGNKR